MSGNDISLPISLSSISATCLGTVLFVSGHEGYLLKATPRSKKLAF